MAVGRGGGLQEEQQTQSSGLKLFSWSTPEYMYVYLIILNYSHIQCTLAIILSTVPIPYRVFRTMFKEGKGVAAPGRFSSPLVRRKLNSTQYAPLQGRKSRLPGLGIIKKKGSVPDDLGPGASGQEPNSLTPLISRSFSEDPRHVQIKEQVCCVLCVCVCVCAYLHVHDVKLHMKLYYDSLLFLKREFTSVHESVCVCLCIDKNTVYMLLQLIVILTDL